MVIKLTTMASEILITDIRMIGLETFIPWALFRMRRFDMKNSNDNFLFIWFQKYGKLLCMETIFVFLLVSCSQNAKGENRISGTIVIEEDTLRIPKALIPAPTIKNPVLGIDRLHLFVDSLKGKRIAVVGNQTSMVKGIHLVDTLLSLQLNVVKVFSPEHGFRGDVDAGEKVDHSVDEKTGIPLVSLYGNNKKPSPSQLDDVDVIIYDIQDVGVRFYTFISTLHYVMEACAEQKKQVVVLDRPNPNGHYIDGPVLESEYKSFVGMHPVPIVYGMTIGEYAMMINGEGWLDKGLKCDLWIIPCKNYTHKTKYNLPVAPSPNLKSEAAISLYPSLCLFEATTVSIGRGTEKPFEIFGHPRFPKCEIEFCPKPQPGAKNPPHDNKICYGFDLNKTTSKRTYEINLNYLIQARDLLGDSAVLIDQNGFFNRLAGTKTLKEQLYKGWSAKEIRESWKPGIENFLVIRKKYLLYD
jgi:uncharacterized protein YbbC (DUF1343 family)